MKKRRKKPRDLRTNPAGVLVHMPRDFLDQINRISSEAGISTSELIYRILVVHVTGGQHEQTHVPEDRQEAVEV